jgi:hypothetical protein
MQVRVAMSTEFWVGLVILVPVNGLVGWLLLVDASDRIERVHECDRQVAATNTDPASFSTRFTRIILLSASAVTLAVAASRLIGYPVA